MQLLKTILSLALAAPLLAAPPGVGDQAPDFTAKTPSGDTVKFAEVTAEGPTVLVMLRGYPGYQCPACDRQVHDFLSNAKKFAKKNAEIVLIYPGPPADLDKRAEEFSADKNYPENFHLVLDPGYDVTNLYDLRWDAPDETAYPATFVMNPGRKVTYSLISDSHGGRTTAAQVLKQIK